MSRRSRDKGAAFEREVVAAFKGAGLQAERHAPLQANAAATAPDVVAERVGRIECKRRARGFSLRSRVCSTMLLPCLSGLGRRRWSLRRGRAPSLGEATCRLKPTPSCGAQ